MSAFLFLQAQPASGQPEVEWSRTYEGLIDDWAYSVIQTSDGVFAIAGYTESYGAGLSDFWLVKTDPKGIKEWSRTYGGEEEDVANSIIQTSDEGFAIAGYTESYGAGGGDFWVLKLSGPPRKPLPWTMIYIIVAAIAIIGGVLIWLRRR